MEGSYFETGFIVKEGWAIRHKDLADGRRQILDFVLPGDLVGIEAKIQPIADHTVTTLTDLRVSPLQFRDLDALLDLHPRLAMALVWVGARQMAVFSEHILSLGRRSASERIAHLILEIWRRLRLRGLASGQTFEMPVTQAVMADALGLSNVHVNRSLRSLEKRGLVVKRREKVEILDLGALALEAQFDAQYLAQRYVPRELRPAT